MGFASACGGSSATLVKVDGSSTVFPITEAMAEEFQREHSGVQVTVGIAGTGGGFQRFCNGETQVSNASRPIKPVEVEACRASGVEYIELPVAYDGLSVLVHPDNDWVDFLSVEELKEIWKPDSTVMKWSDVRAGWPDKEMVLVGADTDSGTFDYFTAAIVGKEGASRPDYTASSDDNVLVTAIAREKNALGYFGFAYYAENTDKLKLVPIDPGAGPVLPSRETISNGAYVPLSRPLFIYINAQDAGRADVQEFVRYYLDARNLPLVRDVGYVELPEGAYALVRARFEARTTGSTFAGAGSHMGVSVERLLGRE
jgi:phosphate transport system substrate-binding protein